MIIDDRMIIIVYDGDSQCNELRVVYKFCDDYRFYIMSFATLRQQIDNWTLHQDDQVTSPSYSSSMQSKRSPKPSSNPKNK